MKKLIWSGLILALLLPMVHCKKGGGGGNACASETPIQVTTSPVIGSVEAPAPGPNFPLNVSVTSIPSAGVTITVTAKPESGGAAFFTETRSSTTITNNFNITGTPQTTASLVEITVASKSCPNNKFTGSYRYSRK